MKFVTAGYWHTPFAESVQDFKGFEVTDFAPFKPGVVRVGMERNTAGGRERVNCVAKQTLVTTAIEMGILKRR
jgi:hypothetical protein